MTTIICSGTLFSNWRQTLNIHLPMGSFEHSRNDEISAFSQEICEQQYPESDELDWKPFTPDDKYKSKACQLLSGIENQSLITLDESSGSLYLNFWKTVVKDAGFVLFFSSPELELSNYISNHSFEASRIEMVINAWVIRTKALLTFFMNNRDRCLLISVQSVESDKKLFIQALNGKFDLNLTESNPPELTDSGAFSVLIEYLSTTLLLKSQYVSELYDEVRSAASLICDRDKSIPGIDVRNKLLIDAFLKEATSCQQVYDKQAELETSLYLNQLQITQMQEELEFYFGQSIEQEKVADIVAKYLGNDSLLNIVRQVRQTQ